MFSRLGEINFENLFIDGTKIKACANKCSFIWKKATAKNEARFKGKVRKLLSSLGYEQVSDKTVTVTGIRGVLDDLRKKSVQIRNSFTEAPSCI